MLMCMNYRDEQWAQDQIRNRATIRVREPVSGEQGRRRYRRSTPANIRRAVTAYEIKVHPLVMEQALKLAQGDASRLTIVSETEVRVD